MKTFSLLLALPAIAALAACGGYAAPTERMIASESAARGAREVGAQNSPQAALHLKLAEEEIAQAKSLMESGDNKRADFVLLRAKGDAELALALAKENAAKLDAQRASEQTKSLEQNQ